MAGASRIVVARELANEGVITISTLVTETNRAVGTRRWVVDPSVDGRVQGEARLGLRTVTGRFTRFGGSYTARDGGATIELDIDAASVDTGNGQRDR
jgi:polyisoprenoid-binding protein YceI